MRGVLRGEMSEVIQLAQIVELTICHAHIAGSPHESIRTASAWNKIRQLGECIQRVTLPMLIIQSHESVKCRQRSKIPYRTKVHTYMDMELLFS